MAAKKEFERQFIWRDEKRIEGTVADYKRSVDRVNAMFPKVEKAVGRKLSDEEKVDLAHYKAEAVLKMLRPNFPFPNADDEFNLNALGLKIQPLLQELRELPGIVCPTKIHDGQLDIADNFIAEITESNTYYTQNKKQNEALKLGKDLIELLNKAEKMGLTDKYFGLKRIEQGGIRLLHYPFGADGVKVNRYVISEIIE